MIVSRRRACRARMWSAYAGNFSPPRRRTRGKLFSCITVGTSASAALDHRVDQVLGEPGAVLDAVDARLDQPGQDASPKQCAVTLAPWSWATAIASAKASAGNDGARSPVVALDPVADQLHPAVAALRLLGDVRRELGRLDLVGVVADVALGAGDVPTGADQPGQVVAVVDPARCRRPSRSRAGAALRRPGRRPPAPRWSPRRRRRGRRARRGSGRRPGRARSSPRPRSRRRPAARR